MHDNAKLISQARVNERTLELYIDETITIQETKRRIEVKIQTVMNSSIVRC